MKKYIVISVVLLGSVLMTAYSTRTNDYKVVLPLSIADIEALGDPENGNTSCTATSNCFDLSGKLVGSVSCTGKVCTRGVEKGGLFGRDVPYVECDGQRTRC